MTAHQRHTKVDGVRRLLASHHPLSKDGAEAEALLRRLAPAWGKLGNGRT